MTKLMSPREFCGWAGIALSTLYLWWSKGEGPVRSKAGRRVFITKEDAQEWLRRHRQAP